MSFILQPAAAGAGTNTAVASGTISNGIAVVMNSDGTVSAVATATNPSTISFSASVDFSAPNTVGTSEQLATVYDPVNKKIVVFWSSGSGSWCVVGTVSGSTITFGSIVTVGAVFNYISGCYHTTNGTCIFVANYQAITQGYAFVVSVSGTVPTVTLSGSSYSTGAAHFNSICYDASADKCLITFKDLGFSNYGTAVVATVSGTTVSFGTKAYFGVTTVTNRTFVSYDTTAQKSVLSYGDNSTTLRILTVTISGTTPSFGSSQNISSASTLSYNASAYDSVNNKTVIIYINAASSSKVFSVVATVSGTSISLGSSNTVSTVSNANYSTITYNPSIGKFDIAYATTGVAYAYAIVGTLSGTTLSVATEIQVNSSSSDNVVSCYDANSQKFVLSLGKSTSGNSYVGSVGSGTTLTTTNFFGISSAAYASGATASINTIGGLNLSQSGLTPGTVYYVQNDGTLGTSPGSVSVIAGQAKSATSLIVKS